MDKVKSLLKSKRAYTVLICGLFLLAVILRVFQFVQPEVPHEWQQLSDGDANGDYLIADHMVRYGEFPINGPDGLFGSYWVSPAYFYLLTTPLWIVNNVKFMHLFNLVLQILGLVAFYFLAKTLFGKDTALFAFALFGLSSAAIWQSYIAWQPYTMHPFVISSYLLLALGYRRKSVFLVASGVSVFILSVALHYSVLAAAPAYIILAVLALRSMKASFKGYVATGLTAVGTQLLMIFPILLAQSEGLMKEESLSLLVVEVLSTLSSSIKMFLLGVVDGATALVGLIVNGDDSFASTFYSDSIVFLSTLVVLGLISLYLVVGRGHSNYKLTALLIFGLTLTLLVTALLRQDMGVAPRYLIALMGPLAIVLTEVVLRLGDKTRWPALVRMVTCGFLLLVVLVPVYHRHLITNTHASAVVAKTATLFTVEDGFSKNDPLVEPIASEVEALARDMGNIHFFDIERYRNDQGAWERSNNTIAFIWTQLERRFDAKLVRVDSSARRDYSVIAEAPRYIFLICGELFDKGDSNDFELPEELEHTECHRLLADKLEGYRFVKDLYSTKGDSIKLMEAETIS